VENASINVDSSLSGELYSGLIVLVFEFVFDKCAAFYFSVTDNAVIMGFHVDLIRLWR